MKLDVGVVRLSSAALALGALFIDLARQPPLLIAGIQCSSTFLSITMGQEPI